MEKLKKNFETIGFSGDDLAKILSAFTLQVVKKNELVVEEGKVSKHIGFVESGMFQYFVLKDGDEITTYISIENTFLASLLSFIGEVPARENIRALTDSSISLISKTSLQKLINELPRFKEFYIGLLEASICGIDATRHDLIVLTAEQRYEKMLTEEPHLLQKIPLQYLASILGVTPRHLSRIRGNIR
ncbi:Crp/Fnr family transcriptional regulator [Spirosoma sp. KCTC 42546]|uniref:Crp/Fnr family transcriptional regulator n=1 Tax=Spirosoma sp. KCTC 42546 TaxID=2520506 RepID=UPI00115708A2|nr:Crp/Fnr family transcriptional regulator [Spirosoma sp. KCTC 42546]QDK82575.1 Crp/Fnr family transcriptional regulator [Spirosoma sp. KCTC 42546]